MLKRSNFFFLCLLATNTYALPGNLPSGNSLVSKGGYTGIFHYSSASNPASLPILLRDESFDLGGGNLPAIALEVGSLDNLAEDFEALEDALDRAKSAGSGGGESITAAEAGAIKANFDDFVGSLDDSAYINLELGMPVPSLPIMFKAFDGVVAITLEGSISLRMTALGSELIYDDVAQDLSTDTSIYVRSGEFLNLGASYGRELQPLTLFGEEFLVNVGGTLKVSHGGLSRQVIAIDDDDGDESAFDRAGDNYDLNKTTSVAVGLDLGAMLHNQKWIIGATLRNLIPQEFDYADIGKNCVNKPTPGQQKDCQSAANFSDRIDLSETYKLDPQLMVEGSYMVHRSGLRVFGSVESNKVDSVTGGEYQWAVAGVAFSGPWWLPSIEASYNKNFAGEKLDMLAFGAQFFKVVNVQLSLSPDKVKNDGDSFNRAAAISISFLTTL